VTPCPRVLESAKSIDLNHVFDPDFDPDPDFDFDFDYALPEASPR